MFVRLERSEFYRGKKHEAGSVIEVGDDLGGRLVRSGRAKQAKAGEAQSASDFPAGKSSITASQIDAMEWPDQRKLASSNGIRVVGVKKTQVISELKAHYGVE